MLTLGVRNVGVARRFYVDGLGWPVVFEVEEEVVFIQIRHGSLLSLYAREDLSHEAGEINWHLEPAPIALGQLVADEQTVLDVLDEVSRVGGTVIAPGQPRPWGGFSGYFADPDGYRWEVAHNPGFVVAEDGSVTIEPVS